MKLTEWFEEHGHTMSSFSKLINRDKGGLSRMMNGLQYVTDDIIDKVRKATNEHVFYKSDLLRTHVVCFVIHGSDGKIKSIWTDVEAALAEARLLIDDGNDISLWKHKANEPYYTPERMSL